MTEQQPAPLGQEQEAAIRARWASAVPGPWFWNSYSSVFTIGIDREHYSNIADKDEPPCGAVCHIYGGPKQLEHGDELVEPEARSTANAIAHAPTDVMTLLTEIDRLRAALAEAGREAKHMRQVLAEDAELLWLLKSSLISAKSMRVSQAIERSRAHA